MRAPGGRAGGPGGAQQLLRARGRGRAGRGGAERGGAGRGGEGRGGAGRGGASAPRAAGGTLNCSPAAVMRSTSGDAEHALRKGARTAVSRRESIGLGVPDRANQAIL